MFLHIGSSRVVAGEDIIGIFDIRIKDKQCNKEFLQTVKSKADHGNDEVKSFIVTSKYVSYSPIAPITLRKRFQANVLDK
ncbi:MAG: DUF370 domain-containing protein [Dethiobacter sp.]|jgi:hypothetical protein|nr:DUF370 domain-containing protein [Dethiobacter sp.]MBS3901925.1 DUF370 domain-containing protein [Dethiobacter sp.]MBS3989504.1 DUF370 domain-containing protein [Dethiobacter sp.]